jgi:hypothetical protein
MLDQQVAALNFLNLHAHMGGYQAEFLCRFLASTSSISPSVIPNVPSSQSQKSPGAVKSHESSSVGNKGISGLANPQCTQKCPTSLPTSVSITPLPPSESSVPCSANTSTSPSTKFCHSENSKPTPSLQQKLRASQALAESASSRSSVSSVSLSVSKATSQVSTSVAQLPLTVTTAPYTLPKDQVLFSPQPQKSSNPNSYISLLKGDEGMLTAGVSISQVTSTPVNPTASTKQSALKLLSFRKHAIIFITRK